MKIDHTSIDHIVQNFDYGKVHFVMRSLEWTWANKNQLNELSVPTVDQLKARSLDLMLQAVSEVKKLRKEKPKKKELRFETSTGGFEVIAISYRDTDTVFVSLRFILQEWDNLGEFDV